MKKSKYRSVKAVYNNIEFHSRKEARYCATLDVLKMAKGNDRVIKYELQPRYDIIVNDIKIGFYKADFKVIYPDRIEVVDVKGYKKGAAYQMFKLKKRLVEALFDIKIIEV